MAQFRVLGPVEIVAGDQTCTPTQPKVRSVLALLLLRARRIVPISSLIEELWGHNPPHTAIATVHTYIYHLRRLFEEQGLNPPGDHLIATKPAGYMIQAAPEQIDATIFERLTAQGSAALRSGHPGRSAIILRRALELWTGAAIAGVPRGNLLQAHAAHLEERRIDALQTRILADARLGKHRELVGELKSLVSAYPLNEWFHGQLIAALCRCGRRGEALGAYQHLRALLRDELGIDPAPELQRLQREVLAFGAPSAARTGPRAAAALTLS